MAKVIAPFLLATTQQVSKQRPALLCCFRLNGWLGLPDGAANSLDISVIFSSLAHPLPQSSSCSSIDQSSSISVFRMTSRVRTL